MTIESENWSPITASQDPGAGLRAVLVDDTATIRMLIRLALENVGIEIVGEAGDGAAGVELVAHERPDVVVLDVAMPVMDGFEALPLMRAQVPGVRVVILSGFQASMVGDAALGAGADAFVEKGQLDELVRTVLRVCASPGSGETETAAAALPAPVLSPVAPIRTQEVALAPVEREVALAAELVAARADLEQLAYILSHDLAEPVGVISGFAARLGSHLAEGDTVGQEFLEFVTDGAHRMQGLLDDVLAYVRAGRDQPLEDLDLPGVWASVRAGLAARIMVAGAHVEVGQLPDRVTASRLVVSQVLQNLVVNALTFIPEGLAPQVQVSAGTEADGRWWLEVADNGIGIAPADRERIFSPFKRVHGRDDFPGNGIGLAICRQLVDRAGGRITVGDSAEGGTVFRVVLPQARAVA